MKGRRGDWDGCPCEPWPALCFVPFCFCWFALIPMHAFAPILALCCACVHLFVSLWLGPWTPWSLACGVPHGEPPHLSRFYFFFLFACCPSFLSFAVHVRGDRALHQGLTYSKSMNSAALTTTQCTGRISDMRKVRFSFGWTCRCSDSPSLPLPSRIVSHLLRFVRARRSSWTLAASICRASHAAGACGAFHAFLRLLRSFTAMPRSHVHACDGHATSVSP